MLGMEYYVLRIAYCYAAVESDVFRIAYYVKSNISRYSQSLYLDKSNRFRIAYCDAAVECDVLGIPYSVLRIAYCYAAVECDVFRIAYYVKSNISRYSQSLYLDKSKRKG